MAVLFLLSLAACGGTPDTGASDTASSDSESAASESAAGESGGWDCIARTGR